MRITESLVHCAVRAYLKRYGWSLVAGQFPGGTDDECHILNVMDPELCGDNCPDPSRHSENKLVPDLFALRDGVLLVIEMKPTYSADDAAKLRLLLTERRAHLDLALVTFAQDRSIPLVATPSNLVVVPGLAFGWTSPHPPNPDFCHFLVKSLNEVTVVPPLSHDAPSIGQLFV